MKPFFVNPEQAARAATHGIVPRRPLDEGKPCVGCPERLVAGSSITTAPVAAPAAPAGGPPRVGIVSPSWTVGGVERWFLSLCRMTTGVEFVGVAVTEEPGSALVDLDLVRETEAFCPVALGAGAVERLLDTIDVVIVWGTDHNAFYDRFKARGGRCVFVSHGMGEWTRRKVESWTPHADALAAVSRSALIPFDASVRDRVRVIHNGIEYDRIVPTRTPEAIRDSWGLKPGTLAIGYCGRFSEEKNPAAAAHAAAKLSYSTAVYQCPPYSRPLAVKAVSEIVPGRCVFPSGPVSDFYAGVDCLVLASKQEGFALAITEAWAAGVPVIATNVGAIDEMEKLHGQLVIRVEHDPAPWDLAVAVQTAVSPRRREMVERARALAWSHFSAGRMAREWGELFAQTA